MPEDTPEISRRRFLRGASLGVAAGVAAAAALPSAASLVAAAQPAARSGGGAEPADIDLSAVGSDVIAHVRDASTGEIAVIVGGSERVYHDPTLVARLLAGARRVDTEA
jgi:anaerobic selenocysteine-containing dehydrogenase